MIDRRSTPPTGLSPAAASIRRLGVADAAAVAWFHPPSLAADLHAKRDAANDPTEKAVLTQTAKVWAACDGLAVYVRPDRGLQVGLVAAVDPARLPAEVRAVLYPAAGGTAWGAVPADALFAVGGRLDLRALTAAAGSFLPNGGKELTTGLADGIGPLVGRSNLVAVLAGVGPEWVAWADAPATGWVPQWTVAVKLSADVRKPVVQGLDFAVGLLRLAYNRDHADPLDLSEDVRDGRTVKYLSAPGLPPGLRPAYGVKDGYLVLAGSPDRVHQFAVKDVSDPPLVRLNTERLRAFVTSRRDELAAGLAAQNGRPVADLKRELDELMPVLRALNRIELRHAVGDGLIRLTLDVEPVKSLK